MVRTEALSRRPTWKELNSHAGAFAFNLLNLVSPAPITYFTAAFTSFGAASFTALEVANLTTPEKNKKWAAVFEGVGAVVANRGLAMIVLSGKTEHSEMFLQGAAMLGFGLVSYSIGVHLERETKAFA